MIMFGEFQNKLQGKEVTIHFASGESAIVILEDFIHDTEVDKKGNQVVVFWGILAKYKGKLITWRKEEISGFELTEKELEGDS